MSQRRRLLNSLRWRAVGWMEMGLSQADVSNLKTEDSVSRRPVPGRPRATTPAEDRFLALSARRRRTTMSARCRPLSSIRKKNLRYYGAKSSSQCRSVCKKTILRSYAGQEIMFLGRSGLLCFTDVRFTMESDSGRLLIWRNSALDTFQHC
ncbi:paired domain-containing protein [Trichonephila clavipes]|nr:paired domain-containing protein [Trichonephila clavipes]